MPRYELNCAMLLPDSRESVFAVFEDPRNLAEITPDFLCFHILSEADLQMRAGLRIDYRIRWMGIPLRWRTEITHYDPPLRFVDEQIRGPYRLWRHTHTFEPADHGVVVRDRVEYELPCGVLGVVVHALLVRRQLLNIFRYRQLAIARRFQAAIRELQAPVILRVR